MRTRLWMPSAAVASICFAATNLYAIQSAASVQETSGGSLTQYGVLNNTQITAHPFDITLFVASTISSNPTPTTSNLNWIAQSLTASSWTQVMGGVSTLLTWQQYTGMTFTQVFPSNPLRLNGYFLNYTFDSGSGNVSFPADPIFPSDPIKRGFFFQGGLDSTFLVDGPSDATVPSPPSSFFSFENTTTDVPEPGSLSLCLFALVGAAAFVRRTRRTPLRGQTTSPPYLPPGSPHFPNRPSRQLRGCSQFINPPQLSPPYLPP
jgi:PEP-CTERM motif-containing protein